MEGSYDVEARFFLRRFNRHGYSAVGPNDKKIGGGNMFVSPLLKELYGLKTAAVVCFLAGFFVLGVESVSAAQALYIPDNSANSVSVFDGDTLKVDETITAGHAPYGVTVDPDGRTVLVTNLADDSVSIIDIYKKEVIGTVEVGDAPFGLTVSPDSRFAYVANAGSNNVSVIRIDKQEVVSTIPVGDCPHGVALVKSKLYVTNYCSASVSVIDTSSRTVIGTIPVGAGPHGISARPSGDFIYVANVFDNTISVISASSQSVVKTVKTGKWPFSSVVKPSGDLLYVSIHGEKSIEVINTSTYAIEKNIFVGGAPHGIDIDSSGSRIYVANEGSGTIAVIDADTLSPLSTITGVTTPIAFGDFIADSSVMALPAGNEGFHYSSVVSPSPDPDPYRSKPFSVGPVAGGGNILTFRLKMDKFSGPVNIYVVLFVPAISPDIFLLAPDLSFRPLYEGLVAWKNNTRGPVDSSFFGDIPMSALPPVDFIVGVYVTPAGSADSSYLWTTDFKGQYGVDSVTNTLVNTYGADGAFDAVMLAMDKGYSLRQIADSAVSNRLQTNGYIINYSGTIEGPEDSPHGLIAAGSSNAVKVETRYVTLDNTLVNTYGGDGAFDAVMLAMYKGYSLRQIAGTEYVTLDDLLATTKEIAEFNEGANSDGVLGTLALKYICVLKEAGYSVEEIVDGILLGTIKREQITEHGIESIGYTIVDSEGNYIPPKKNRKEGVFHDVPCTGPDHDGDGTPDACDNDDDNDGAPDSIDCSTFDAGVFPDNPEICEDGIDQDCDGVADNAPCGCKPTPAYPQHSCGSACIAASEQCCEPSTGSYCEAGYNCFYSPKECCEEGMVPCGEGSKYCVIPGYEDQCIFNSNAAIFQDIFAATPWNTFLDLP